MTTNEARKQAKALSENREATVAVNTHDGNHHLYSRGKYQGKQPGWVGGHTDREECPCVRVIATGN